MTRGWELRVEPADPSRPLTLGRGSIWAFAATTLAGSVAAWSMPGAFEAPWKPCLAIVLQLAMLAIATRWSRGDARGVLTYFALQSLLASVVVFSTQGRSGLVWMPLISQMSLVRPRSRTVVAMLAWCVLFLVSLRSVDLRVLGVQGFGFLTAGTFTWLFTEVAMRERRARLDVERLARSLEAANAGLAQLAVERERVRFAREIHDGVGHSLTAARMQLEAARVMVERDHARALEAIDKAARLMVDGLDDVRQSVRALRETTTHEESIADRLRTLSESGPSCPRVEFSVEGAAIRLSPALELTLYRAAQEALTNARRHASADVVNIDLRFHPSCVHLAISDDGVGALPFEHGFGLTGLVERVERHGGEVGFETRASGGVRVSLVVPLPGE